MSSEFKPTPREEEILNLCVDYEQFREEIDDLKAKLKALQEEIQLILRKNGLVLPAK